MRRSRISGLDLATNRIKVRKLHSDARQLFNATRFTGFASCKHDTVWEDALILLYALMVLHNPLLLAVRLDRLRLATYCSFSKCSFGMHSRGCNTVLTFRLVTAG